VGVADFHTLMNEKYEDIENMLGVNIYPSTHLTHFLIPRFLERKKSKKLNSLVIDFSSTAEECIYPGSVVYSITKRYNAFMNEGLRFEYPEIEFACVKPGPVLTQLLLSNNGQKMPFKVETKDYVKALLSSLRTGVNHGHWKHTLMGILLRIWPYLVNIIGVRILMPIAVKNGLIR
jgi:short-subunit dehydrogenase